MANFNYLHALSYLNFKLGFLNIKKILKKLWVVLFLCSWLTVACIVKIFYNTVTAEKIIGCQTKQVELR